MEVQHDEPVAGSSAGHATEVVVDKVCTPDIVITADDDEGFVTAPSTPIPTTSAKGKGKAKAKDAAKKTQKKVKSSPKSGNVAKGKQQQKKQKS